jgi:hypothetical protein
MKIQEISFRAVRGTVLFCAGILLAGSFCAFAQDAATFISATVSNGTVVMPRSTFTQTWTFQNTGTTTWTNGNSYTLNIQSNDSIGAIPVWTNTSSTSYHPKCILNGGKSVPPGGTGSYTMSFIVPEAPGPLTDYFQLNSASSVFFGPMVSVSIVVAQAGNTNQYDRARAVAYANNYCAYFVSDGCFWTNSDGYTNCGVTGAPSVPFPTYVVGDDCAHFVSSCIGREPHMRGGGINISNRAGTYGEPGAQRLCYPTLVAPGYATEVYSLDQMEPGDVIGWNWEGDTSTNSIDHVTLYMGNGLIAAHAASHLGVGFPFYVGTNTVYHLIHILDSPTINMSVTNNNMVLSWTTNWSSYSLYSSTSLAPGAPWTKVSTAPKKVGAMNILTNTMSPSAPLFYRLSMP